MAGTYETFVAYGTDIVGLERFFRTLQSLFMILTAYPSLIAQLLPLSPPSVHISTETSLTQLQTTLNLTRRSMRLFVFLDKLNLGWKLYADGAEKGLETWLEVFGKSCLGIFHMLESATLPDLLGVDHLEVFGPAKTKELNLQAQVFWFLGLYASVLTTCVRLVRLLAYSPVPQKGALDGLGEKKGEGSPEEEEERAKLAADKRKEERRAWAKEVSAKSSGLALKLISDMLDIILPANAVGWIQVHPGLVGIAMLCSSITTSVDVWERCERQVQGKQA